MGEKNGNVQERIPRLRFFKNDLLPAAAVSVRGRSTEDAGSLFMKQMTLLKRKRKKKKLASLQVVAQKEEEKEEEEGEEKEEEEKGIDQDISQEMNC